MHTIRLENLELVYNLHWAVCVFLQHSGGETGIFIRSMVDGGPAQMVSNSILSENSFLLSKVYVLASFPAEIMCSTALYSNSL